MTERVDETGKRENGFLKNNWGKVLFCIDIIRNFAIANKLQWRPSAAAQQRPSELASAFALHDGCTVITRGGRR